MDANIIENIVRIGTVRNIEGRKARVWFDDIELLSGWLPVLQQHEDGWMPRVGAVVAALYIPVPDGDGFVLGEIK